MIQPNFATLIDSFVQHGTFLREWSPNTVRTYRASLRELPPTITRASLDAMVIGLRQRGLSPGGVNLRVRSINSFLTWLHEEGHLPERFRIKLLRNPPKPIDILSDADIRTLMAHRPKGKIEIRTWTLAVLLLDCGLRINEALTLERAKVDLDNLILRVLGKGNKERLVPISTELRKHVFRLLKQGKGNQATSRYLFSKGDGARMERNHAYQDLRDFCKRIGIKGKVHPHAFRHAFAVHSTRNGLDVYRLSRILGHSSMTTTQLYLRSMGVEHLREGHEQFSPLKAMIVR
jgi:integrase/recombinase XerD